MQSDGVDVEVPKVQYLSLNEKTNAIDYLRRAASFIREAQSDVTAWKWAVIALHGALYGFAVAAARGTDDEQLTKNGGKLLGFGDVLKLCQDSRHMGMLIGSTPLVLSLEEQESLKTLTGLLRNEFMHFKPKLWLIEVHGMPQIALDALRVTGFLALETNTYVHLTEAEDQEVRLLVRDTSVYLKDTALYRELLQAQKAYRRGDDGVEVGKD